MVVHSQTHLIVSSIVGKYSSSISDEPHTWLSHGTLDLESCSALTASAPLGIHPIGKKKDLLCSHHFLAKFPHVQYTVTLNYPDLEYKQ